MIIIFDPCRNLIGRSSSADGSVGELPVNGCVNTKIRPEYWDWPHDWALNQNSIWKWKMSFDNIADNNLCPLKLNYILVHGNKAKVKLLSLALLRCKSLFQIFELGLIAVQIEIRNIRPWPFFAANTFGLLVNLLTCTSVIFFIQKTHHDFYTP